MHRALVWATAEDHALIGNFLEERGGRAPVEQGGAPLLRSYAAPDINQTLAVQLLTGSFPAATFQVDTTARSIVVEASREEHQQISQLIEQLRGGSSATRQMQVQAYPLGALSPERAERLRACRIRKSAPGCIWASPGYWPNRPTAFARPRRCSASIRTRSCGTCWAIRRKRLRGSKKRRCWIRSHSRAPRALTQGAAPIYGTTPGERSRAWGHLYAVCSGKGGLRCLHPNSFTPTI